MRANERRRLRRPVYGVIFLFKYLGAPSRASAAPPDGTYDARAVEEEGLFFAAQTIQNACGTQAVLSVVLNNDAAGIDMGPELRAFKDFTAGFPADLRGEALSNSSLIRSAHNAFARASPFVDETQREATGAADDLFHFIAYTVHHGTLYELDGLQPAPISHGPCVADDGHGGQGGHVDFADAIVPVLQRRIARYPAGEVRFNLMAVCRDRRARAIEMGDTEALARENRRRARWAWENALRRHNFVGFTAEVLKGVVGMKLGAGGGEYERWVAEAREATEKRIKARDREVE